jgi:putative phosphoesterase
MPRRGRSLPQALLEELAHTDLILHLGDFTGPEVVDFLESCAPLIAVHGNNDSSEVLERFPARRVVQIEEMSLVLLHGDKGGRTALQAALAESTGDAVLFGHSHLPYTQTVAGRLLFNPGSPTERRWGPHRSFGLLEIGTEIDARLILLE